MSKADRGVAKWSMEELCAMAGAVQAELDRRDVELRAKKARLEHEIAVNEGSVLLIGEALKLKAERGEIAPVPSVARGDRRTAP